MKTLITFFTAVVFFLAIGIASAGQEEGTPWQEKESTPLLKNKEGQKNNVKKDTKKDKKDQKKKDQKKKEAKKVRKHNKKGTK